MSKKTKGRFYTDDAPLTASELRTARPLRNAFPELAAASRNGTLKRRRGQRGAQKAPKKIQVNIRFSPEVIAFFKGRGEGWQTRIDDTLRAIVEATR